MFRHSKPVIWSLSMIVSVSVGLLQEQAFKRVHIKYGILIKYSPTRSIRTCVDYCLQHCECRYVRFTKSTQGCQLFDDVLLHYGSEPTPPTSDVSDFKKVYYRFINSKSDITQSKLTNIALKHIT